MRHALAILFALMVFAAARPAAAHEVRPAYLQLRELEEGRFQLLFKVPARGDLRLSLEPEFPEGCAVAPRTRTLVGGGYIDRGELECAAPLDGRRIAIRGLEATLTDALVRIERRDGRTQTARLVPHDASFEVDASGGAVAVASTYTVLGVEHILFGIDHLLFVLGLVFLARGARLLIATITAFTVAHSITLAGAALGWLEVPLAPVEAVIALSIVFVAQEIVASHRGRASLATRRPWLVALAFGLLHGFGFAGALAETGLPAHAVPLSLLFFNVGVELGQLAFVAALVLAATLLSRLRRRGNLLVPDPRASFATPAAYLIGAVAMFWFFERTLVGVS